MRSAVRRSRLVAEEFLSNVLHVRGAIGKRFSKKSLRSKRARRRTANLVTKFDTLDRFLESNEEEGLNIGTSVVTNGFVRLPQRVAEPLVKWRRVLVNVVDDRVSPMDSRSSLVDFATHHNSHANIVVKKEMFDNAQVNLTEKVVKKELVEMPTPTCAEAASDATSDRWKVEVESPNLAALKEECVFKAEQYHPEIITKGMAVYAVYFGTYYPAVVLSVNGIFGYEVRFVSDNVVKSVPVEAVLSLSSLEVGHKCMVNELPDGPAVAALITALPHDVETGTITVSVLNKKEKVLRKSDVRWRDLSFPIRLWRKEIKRRLKLKINVAPDFSSFDAADERDIEASNGGNNVVSHSSHRFSEPDTISGAVCPSHDGAVGREQVEVDMRSNSCRGKHRTRVGSGSTDTRRILRTQDPALYSPLWANFRSPDEEQPTTAQRSSWPLPIRISAILKVRPPTPLGDRSFVVTLEGRRWHCHYRVMRSQLGNQEEAAAFEERERMIENMRIAMEKRSPCTFRQQYPNSNRRLNFKKEWRVDLRITETRINRRLRSFGIAPIFIESWTRKQPSMLNFDYLPRSTISVRLQREVIAEGARLRYMYPERTGGCECPRQKCVVGRCPCLVYKKNNSVMMCGQACGCDDSCPSAYLREERQVPLVLFNTRTKGWGVIAPVKIPAGTFLGLYAGHMVTIDDQSLYDNTYVFDINEQVEGGAQRYAIDGTWSGNISRFFNHTCVNPTLEAKVLFTRGNMVTHDLAFFTTRDIEVGEELVFCYSKEVMQQRTFGIPCRCTEGCKSKI